MHGTFRDTPLLAGTDPTAEDAAKASEIRKRSVVIAGHRTSISLENIFWDQLCQIAAGRLMSVNQLVTEIDQSRAGNLSSAIRTYVLKHCLKP